MGDGGPAVVLADTQEQGSGPSGRTQAAMATLGSTEVLFGGCDAFGQLLSDTWIEDGTSWSALTVAMPPSPRCKATMATLGRQAILFGGFNSTYDGDTWAWDGTG
jgi:hypothetical protein